MKLWNGIKRGASAIAYLWLTGVIFLLFIAGYILYGILWVVRYVQLRKKLLFIILPITVALVAGGTVYYLFFPLPGKHDTVTVVIPRGCTVRMIADTLHRHNIITSKKALIAWLKASRIERRVQAGKFSFLTRSGVIAAARALTSPVPLDRTVTIPEGLTMEQVAELVGKTFAVDTAEFIRLCRDTGFIKELGLDAAPSIEGYLFPDTYSFHETETPAEMVRRMVGRFNDEWAKLDTASFISRHLTRRQIVIVASIVEKEAILGAERPRIAGVFFNRLRLGLPLGADPTVRYVFRKWSGPLYMSELNSPSAYNTRRNKGLPPGPICSPGRASLAAAVSPLQTNELYFVAKWDGSGGHEFSLTYEDHVRKTYSIRRNNEQRLRQKEASCGN
ncbi:MAG: endolytic transglycosylase MltG [Chitinispirillaceae bacterium]